jgi:hypothetical protein
MTTSLFRCYAESLEGLRAERSLDLSQASAFPHLVDKERQSWLRRLLDAITANQAPDPGEAPTRYFTWNGIWMGAKRLAAKFGEAFEDRAA